jgi:YtoQ family protein
MSWAVYLSGEIHTDWREQIIKGCEEAGLPIQLTLAVTDHDASDAAGDFIDGETNNFWRDHKSAKINAMRLCIAFD